MAQNAGLFGGFGGSSAQRSPSVGGSGPAGAYFGHGGAAVRVLPHGRGHTVAVIGVGYVGLPTAATLAHLGHRVTCGDADPAKVAMLEQGQVPIVEDHLEELVREGQAAGRLRFVVGRHRGRGGRRVRLPLRSHPPGRRRLGRPLLRRGGGQGDRPRTCVPGTVIVNKSTVPVGSTLVVERVLGRHDVSVVSNPEFLREGTAVADSLHPERIVVGADDQAAAAKVGDLFAGTHAPLLITDAATAETIKYASNAFLATKLSFVNAVAGLCEAVGADVRDVILGLGYDKRIGFEYLRPGPGWGGSCLPKDTRALVHIAEQAGYDFSFLKGAIATNDEQFVRVVDKVRAAVGRRPRGRGDRRLGADLQGRHRRPAELAGRRGGAPPGGQRGHRAGLRPHRLGPGRPEVGSGRRARRLASDGRRARPGTLGARLPRAYAACEGAAAAVVLTEWDEFRWLDFAKVRVDDGHPGGGRCPQPARPGPAAADGLRVHRASVADEPPAGGARRRRVPRLPPVRPPVGRGDEVVCVDDFSTGRRANVAHLADTRGSPWSRPTSPTSLPVDGDVAGRAQPGQPGLAAGLPGPPARDPGGGERGHPARPRARPAPRGPVPAGVDQRGLRRSRCASPDRVLLGQREPGRAPQRLRRGQAVRRGPDHGPPPRASAPTSASSGSSTPTGPRLRPDDGRVVSNFLAPGHAG